MIYKVIKFSNGSPVAMSKDFSTVEEARKYREEHEWFHCDKYAPNAVEIAGYDFVSGRDRYKRFEDWLTARPWLPSPDTMEWYYPEDSAIHDDYDITKRLISVWGDEEEWGICGKSANGTQFTIEVDDNDSYLFVAITIGKIERSVCLTVGETVCERSALVYYSLLGASEELDESAWDLVNFVLTAKRDIEGLNECAY